MKEETKKKISLARTGMRCPESAKQKLRIVNLGKKQTEETKRKISEGLKKRNAGRVHYMVGRKASEETKRKLSLSGRGRVQSKETKEKRRKTMLDGRMKKTEEHKKKISFSKQKEKQWCWKGGVSSLQKKIRNSNRYRQWRTSVFQRDHYTCVWCGKEGGVLNADHIIPFSTFVGEQDLSREEYDIVDEMARNEKYWDIENGKTLCVSCHKKRHQN